jgi:hypothetical protein
LGKTINYFQFAYENPEEKLAREKIMTEAIFININFGNVA